MRAAFKKAALKTYVITQFDTYSDHITFGHEMNHKSNIGQGQRSHGSRLRPTQVEVGDIAKMNIFWF